MRLLLYILIFPAFVLGQQVDVLDADVKAFYTAEGAGSVATGGRGQTVVFVTNTNDSGTGSLRTAVSGSNRYVVFRVGGTITLSSRLTISGSNITIAGETAPGDGIQIYNKETYITGSNVVIRHIRFRAGNNSAADDAVRIHGSSGAISNIILDHCSVSWGRDENLSVWTGIDASRTATNITIQKSILQQPFANKNVLLYGEQITRISFIQNALGRAYDRNIRISTTNYAYPGTLLSHEMQDNYTYGFYGGYNSTNRNQINAVGNVFENPSGATTPYVVIGSDTCSGANCPPSGDTSYTGTQIYVSDNLYNGAAQGAQGTLASYTVGSEVWDSGYNSIGSANVKSTVLTTAGARNGISGLDALDQEFVTLALTEGSVSYVSSEASTSGLPTIASGTPYTDSDGDGLSDEYEVANGAGPGNWFVSPTTRPSLATLVDGTVINQSGATASTRYTHMDIFLGELANDWGTGSPGGGGGSTPSNGVKNSTLIAH